MTDTSPLTLLTEVLEGAMSEGRARRIARTLVTSFANLERTLASGLVPADVADVLRTQVAVELGPTLAEQVVDLVQARLASALRDKPIPEGARVRGARRSAIAPRGGSGEPSFPRAMSGVRPKRRSSAKREAADTEADRSPGVQGAPTVDASSAPAHVARADITVLVVEDDSVVRMVYVRLLRRAGYEVVEAADGAAGLEKALLLRPAVVVTDYQMPKMNGAQLAAELQRSLGEQAPAVFLVTAISALEAPPPGVSLLRRKPLEPGELVAIVDQLRQHVGRKCAGAEG